MKLFGRKKARKTAVQFAPPETQYAVIRSSICTGEAVFAGGILKSRGNRLIVVY